mmetsp:Transcript_59410/g.98525  ORF Transcript_59410/g.98525 Transcript_59410/m.98525 type:complete len:112 (-) Transcript_59410:385-720(-)
MGIKKCFHRTDATNPTVPPTCSCVTTCTDASPKNRNCKFLGAHPLPNLKKTTDTLSPVGFMYKTGGSRHNTPLCSGSCLPKLSPNNNSPRDSVSCDDLCIVVVPVLHVFVL